MNQVEVNALQEQFIFHCKEYWKKINLGDADAANKLTRRNDEIVAGWEKKFTASKFLLPLLAHDDEEVQFAAAAYLVNFPERNDAIAVLRKFANNLNGLVTPSARAVLRLHKVPLQEA
ncbi:hypothetical protein [Herbaspirillum sp. YR522]|uniref:hypothetical protein n=1 Tax=Herbaspirillum sp. YR522 TaxID=1144342 RepID=UPI0012FC9BFB|nr:hypothetical protein [Herbaspirillum sp. YR522]